MHILVASDQGSGTPIDDVTWTFSYGGVDIPLERAGEYPHWHLIPVYFQ